MNTEAQKSLTGIGPAYYGFVFGVVFLVWWLLVGSLALQELVAGLVVAAGVTLLYGRRLAIFTGFRLVPAAPLYILFYLGHFLVAMVKANLDLARRVLSPSLPIHPGFVEVRTKLESPLGKLLLANTITLTPGTLSVDVVGDRILVHWVTCPSGEDLEQATRAIVEPFETRLIRFLK